MDISNIGKGKFLLRFIFSSFVLLQILFAADYSYSQSYLKAANHDVEKWKDARFGMFVHWGPVSLAGTEISWSRAGERRGLENDSPGVVPVDIYDNLYKKFNPVEFNAGRMGENCKRRRNEIFGFHHKAS